MAACGHSGHVDFLWVKEGRVRRAAVEEEPFVPRVFWHLSYGERIYAGDGS